MISLVLMGLLELLPPPAPPAADAPVWRWIKEEHGVKLRTAPSEHPRAPWGEAVAEIARPIDAVIAHLTDFEGAKKFIPRVAEIRLLKRADGEALVYYRFDLPWPISDRDWTVRYRFSRAADGSFLMVWSDANAEGPPPGRAVRVQLVRGLWSLEATPQGTTRARYSFATDFGGHLPQSVVDQTAWRQPLGTIEGVRKALGL
jgi:hypothetical protein